MRLFVSADIPPAHRASLQAALEPLRPLLPGPRWSRPASWHVTLKFLGEVAETALDEVGEVLEDVVGRVRAFETRLTEPGVFPGARRPRVLWMGLADEDHGFRNLAGRLERKLEKIGFSAEGRAFRPHLTLARFKNPRQSRVDPKEIEGRESLEHWLKLFSAREIDRSPFEVAEIALFQSHLGPEGPVYEPKLRLPLRKNKPG